MNFFNFGRFCDVRLFILTLLMSSLLTACGASSQSKTREGNANSNAARDDQPVIGVTQAKAEARQVPSVIQATGSLVADETSDIAPKVAGKVVNVSANVGQFVTQGVVIAKIDDQDARLRLAEARAGVTQAIAGVRQAEARLGLSPNGTFTVTVIPEVQSANANYEQALAELRQAEANEKRYRELVETGDVAVATYESYRTARDTARARVKAAREAQQTAINVARQSNQAIKSAQAAVEAARTQVGTAEQAVADTIVRAPFRVISARARSRSGNMSPRRRRSRRSCAPIRLKFRFRLPKPMCRMSVSDAA